jgi:hypothetical protein
MKKPQTRQAACERAWRKIEETGECDDYFTISGRMWRAFRGEDGKLHANPLAAPVNPFEGHEIQGS